MPVLGQCYARIRAMLRAPIRALYYRSRLPVGQVVAAVSVQALPAGQGSHVSVPISL